MIYLTASYSYSRTNNQFEQITNSAFDRILIEGQVTNEIMEDFYDCLKKIGVNPDYITIRTSDYIVDDNDNSSYVSRGNEIKVDFIYTKPHYFYYVNKFILLGYADEKTYYLVNSSTGMSEKL